MTSERRLVPSGGTSEVRHVARGSLVNFVGMVFGAVIGFGLTVFLSRWLGPRDAGGLFELIALYTIASNTLELGADTGLTRWISRARAIGGIGYVRWVLFVALTPVLVVGSAAAAGLWFAAPEIARIFLGGMPTSLAVSDIRIVAPLVPVGALSACVLAGPRGYGRMWPYLVVEGVGKPAARLALLTTSFVLGLGLHAALVAWCAPVVAGLAVAWLIFTRIIKEESPGAKRRRLPRARRLAAPGAHSPGAQGRPAGVHRSPLRHATELRSRIAADFWRFAGPRGFAGTFQIVVLWLDILLVGAIVSRYAAGLYAAVSRLALVGTFALEGMRLAIAPQLSGLLARRERVRAAYLYQSASRWLILASWPLYILMAIFPAVVLGIFGHRYAPGAQALAILAAAMLVNLSTGNVSVVLLMGGKSSWNAVNALAALAVNVGLNFALLPRLGIVGAAIAWAASMAVDNLAALVEVRVFLGLAPFGPGYLTAVLVSIGCFGASGAAARLVLGETLPALVVAATIGAAVYLAIVYAARDRLRLRSVFAAAGAVLARAGLGKRPGQQTVEMRSM